MPILAEAEAVVGKVAREEDQVEMTKSGKVAPVAQRVSDV